MADKILNLVLEYSWLLFVIAGLAIIFGRSAKETAVIRIIVGILFIVCPLVAKYLL